MYGLPDYLDYNLKVVFVGYNPGEKSARTNRHYGGPGNQFWKLLYQSGLTSRLYKPEEDSLLLNEGYGLTNLVARPSKSSSDLTDTEKRIGAERLKEKVCKYKPSIVCFLGKDIYRYYAGLSSGTPIQYGLVEGELHPGIRGVVGYNPSGRSTIPYAEKLRIFRLLNQLIFSL